MMDKLKQTIDGLERLAEFCFHNNLGWQKNVARNAIEILSTRRTPHQQIAEGLLYDDLEDFADNCGLDAHDLNISFKLGWEMARLPSSLLAVCEESKEQS